MIVAPKAAAYSPKGECNWVCFHDDLGNIHTYEPTNCDDYCEDCIGTIVEKLFADESAERPDGFVEFCFDTESSKENEGFCLCDNCGEHIFVSIIWTEQELEHWLSLDADGWAKSLADNSCCYELMQILDDCYGSSEWFPDETSKIADAVLLYSSRRTEKELRLLYARREQLQKECAELELRRDELKESLSEVLQETE